MLKKITLALLFAIPSLSLAMDLDGFYITLKGGISKSMDTGVIYGADNIDKFSIKDSDLGTGHVFGLSIGKYITSNFRLELEASQRDGLKYDSEYSSNSRLKSKADIDTKSIFINGFYDFESFDISSSSVTPYLGGGLGISRNDMGTVTDSTGLFTQTTDGKKVSQFAYKVAAGTLVSLSEKLSLDINYQYVDFGKFKSGVNFVNTLGGSGALIEPFNGGEIKTQELMVGLQYKF